jgi:hypothetical protein
MERKHKFITHAHYVVTNMERKQSHARTKSEEDLLNKQLATITDTMVRVAQQCELTSICWSFVYREPSNRNTC